MPDPDPEVLIGASQVRARAVGRPFTLADVATDADVHGLATATAMAWVTAPGGGRERAWLTALGAPAEVARLVPRLLAADPSAAGVTVPREAVDLLPRAARPVDGAPWDWWFTTSAPDVQPGEEAVEWLHGDRPEGASEILALLEVASPSHWAPPGHPVVRRWCGVRDGDGRLVACAAETRRIQEYPHLASVATHPDQRGRGLAGAVTAWITRRLLAEGVPAVTLGMYAHNDAARAVYTRLGYTCAHRWFSGSLTGSGTDVHAVMDGPE